MFSWVAYLLSDTEDVVILYEGRMAKLQKKKLDIVNSKRKNTQKGDVG